MSGHAMPLVQVFSPTGELTDIPYEHLHDALNDGAKIAAKMKAPNGEITFIPGDRVAEAMKDGATRVPLDLNDADGGKPGFWSQAGGAAKSVVNAALSGNGPATNPVAAAGQGVAAAGQMAADDLDRQQAGRSTAYRIAAPIAQQVVPGLDPHAMERAADEGNTAGVWAQAAVPAAMAAAPLTIEGLYRGLKPAASAVPKAYQATTDALGSTLRNPVTNQPVAPIKVGAALAKMVGGPEIADTLIPDNPTFRGNENAKQLEARMQEVETARQKELADQEKLKEQDAQSRMRRESQQNILDRKDVKANQTQPLDPIYGPPVPSQEQVIAAGQSAPVLGPDTPSQLTLDKYKASTQSPISTPSSPKTAGEGRPATWTNDTVRNLAAWGDPDAIEQARLRGFGKIPLKYSTVDLTPRSSTVVDAQGKPVQSGMTAQDFLNSLGRNVPDVEIVGSEGPKANASGESAASLEAQSRLAGEKARGIQRVKIDTRSGQETPLIGTDAVDAKAGPYDRIVMRDANGGEVVLDEGEQAITRRPKQ